MNRFALGVMAALGLGWAVAGCMPVHDSWHSQSAAQVDKWARRGQWRLLARELERSPIMTNASWWQQLYDRQVDIGVMPLRARVNVRRAARFGPSRPEFEEIVNTYSDPGELQLVLDQRHEEALLARWAEDDRDPIKSHVENAAIGAPAPSVVSLPEVRS